MKDRARLAEARVRALWRRVAVHLSVAAGAGVLAGLGGLLLLSWALGASRLWQRPSPLPLLLLSVTAAAVGAWIWRIARQGARWTRRAAAAEIERGADLPRGSVQGAVEPGLERPGTSESLVEWHRLGLARTLGGLKARELEGVVARRARRYSFAAALLVLFALTLSGAVWVGARASAARAWAAVLHPVRHLEAPPFPALTVSAASDRVRRGTDLAVDVSAPLRDSVRLVWQPRGEIARLRWYAVSDGHARAVIPRVEAPIRFWAAAPDGAVSDTLEVVPVDPLLLIDVQVALEFPPHTRREREAMSMPLPVIYAPEGTRAIVSGVATRPLERAALRSSGGDTLRFEIVEGRRFRRSFTIRSGAWGWEITGSRGDALEGEPDSLYFSTVPDSAPQVRIAYPGVDTTLAPTMVQPLTVDVRDDYGLSSVELVSWRVSAWGEAWPELVEEMPLADDGPRANLLAILDARGRGFLPGDTLHYFVRALDNAQEPHEGKSREYVLRLPTLDEIRGETIADAKELAEAAERLAENAREYQESARALDRSAEVTPPPGARQERGGAESGVEFRDTEAARRALEEAGDLLEQAEAIQEALRELQDGVERAGLNDQSFLERLRELEALYERILTPELRERIEALREALTQLDPEQIREAIRQIAQGSADFRERVEQSVDLLRRAALEQEFGTLETQADELADAHEQLAEAAADAGADSTGQRVESQARELSDRAESLSERLERFAGELTQWGEPAAGQRASEAEQRAAEAARSDERVARDVRSRRQRAARSAREAAGQMQQAAAALREGREQMQDGWRREIVEALDRAGTEAMELARRQQALNERLSTTDQTERAALRSEEVALKRGLDQIAEQLSDASQSSLLVDPSLMAEAAETEAALEQLLEQLSDGSRQRMVSPDLGTRVSEGLNELAYQLMQAGDAVEAAESGTGVQEALEQLAQLAEQQGEVNAQAGGIMPGDAGRAVLEALRQLAASQRAVAQELRDLGQSMGPRSQVLGQLDALAREAEDIAEELQRGRLDERIVERQGELFQRLLDAGRSLERDEFEKERRAERPAGTEVVRPGDLPPGLLGTPRFPHPGGDVLGLYPPAFRRLILEYFDRLNEKDGAGDS